MTYTILPAAGKAKAQQVPMLNNYNYDYSFLRTMPKGAVAAIRIDNNRKPENIRRAIQIGAGHAKNTSVLDNVLLVW